jgi:N-acetylglucosamine-6-phosphate deacetylase
VRIEGLSALSGAAVRLEIEDGFIGSAREIEPAPGMPVVSPGFIDIQVNGYLGMDYSDDSLSEEDVFAITRALAASGTVAHVPTVITRPEKLIVRNLGIIARAVRSSSDLAAAVPGIHLEGPFISPEDGPRGAHDVSFVRPPDFAEFERWQEAADGLIKIVTLSPEWDGAEEFIRKLSGLGVTAAIGHTAADPDLIARAIRAGARFSTHLGNGSHPSLPRLKNYLFRQLAADELGAGLISDGFHLPEYVVKVMYRAKGADRIVLVSDVAPLAGSKPGRYRWGGIEVRMYEDGHLGLPDSTLLAGAAHLLDWDIPHFMRFTGAELAESIRLCTVNPARLLGLPEPAGTLEPGAPADITVFSRPDSPAERLEVVKTFRRGKIVYEART